MELPTLPAYLYTSTWTILGGVSTAEILSRLYLRCLGRSLLKAHFLDWMSHGLVQGWRKGKGSEEAWKGV